MVSFNYLGHIPTATYDYWMAVVANLRNNQKKWVQMSRILRREGVDERTSGTFFKASVQEFLFFGSETWVVTPRVIRMPVGLQHGVARQMNGSKPWRMPDGRW